MRPLTLFAAGVVALFGWLPTPAVGSSLRLSVADRVLSDCPVVEERGEVLAPISKQLQAVGASVSFNTATQAVTLTSFRGVRIQAKVGSTDILVGNTPRQLVVPPRLINGQLYLPVFGLARALDAVAYHDPDTNTVYLNTVLTNVRVITQPTLTVLLDTGSPVTYKVNRLTDPERVYIDLQGCNFRGAPGMIYTGGGAIQALRVSQFSRTPQVARVVIDLAKQMPYQVVTRGKGETIAIEFGTAAAPRPVKLTSVALSDVSPTVSQITLKCDGGFEYSQALQRNPNKIVLALPNVDGSGAAVNMPDNHNLVRDINIQQDGKQADVAIDLSQMTAFTVQQTSADTLAIELSTARLSDKIVVVDAGHGGKDPGAQSPSGLKEKDLTLDIARRLYDKLVQNGVTALMTRSDDAFVSLAGRTKFAEDSKADLFVSIHLNSSRSPNSGAGTEVYYYNPNSLAFATAVHDALIEKLGLKDGGVRNRMFFVVHHISMPSCLTETCYINNSREEALLRQPEFRQKIADAIFLGIKRYIEGSTPPSSAVSTVTH